MKRRTLDSRPWLRIAAATLLPLLFCSSLQIELGHDHGVLLETAADGAWEHLCVDGHSAEGQRSRDGFESSAEPHRHACEACRLGSQSRTQATARDGAPTELAASQTFFEPAPSVFGPSTTPLPPLRGPPLS